MTRTRKHSRRARGKKNLTSKERAKKEVAKQYKKINKQIISLEKKIPKNEQTISLWVQKGESNLAKLEERKIKFEAELAAKLDKKQKENGAYQAELILLSTEAERLRSELSYSGLALL